MIVFVVNPRSGSNRGSGKLSRWIEQIFGPSGPAYEIWETRDRGHGRELAAQAVARGAQVVAAVGGDGTINEVASSLVGTAVPLAVIPAGSGNGFARNLHIPLQMPQALRLLLQNHTVSIDVGKMNQHYFFNVAGLGLDAQVAAHFERFGIRGPLPYFLIGAREFLRYRPPAIELVWDGQKRELYPLVLSIANLPQYGNGAVIAPRASAQDARLDVCILYPVSIFTALAQVHRLFNGTVDQVKEYQTFQVSELHIRREHPDFIHTDGDPHPEGTELHIQVLPAQLKVLVPPEVKQV